MNKRLTAASTPEKLHNTTAFYHIQPLVLSNGKSCQITNLRTQTKYDNTIPTIKIFPPNNSYKSIKRFALANLIELINMRKETALTKSFTMTINAPSNKFICLQCCSALSINKIWRKLQLLLLACQSSSTF